MLRLLQRSARCAVPCRVRWRAFATSPASELGFDFSVKPDEARRSFERWIEQYTSPVLLGTTVRVRPALLPYFAFDLDVDGRMHYAKVDSRLVEYAGNNYVPLTTMACNNDVQGALPFDAMRHMRSAGGMEAVDSFIVDPWRILPGQALTFVEARMEFGENARVSQRKVSKVYMPAYVFEFEYLGATWPVIVCGRTAKASGLKQNSPINVLSNALSNLSTPLLLVMYVMPRLVPPLGAGLLLWSVFSTVAPMAADKIMGALRRNLTLHPSSVRLLADLYATYDPKADPYAHTSSSSSSFSSSYEQASQSSSRSRARASTAGGSSYQRAQQQQPRAKVLTHYEVLKVPRTASAQEIKDAYRRQVLLKHPDQNKSPNAQEEIKLVLDAYRTLNNPQKKQEYDASLR